ncbi:hypothetical protein [Bradyrhizobium sp. Tv2a-2]|uniref:hypothetical protein n=1 Tax=Bradyrhizobium sp. Tv2a-2 TaxID=113395 RepID=UPI000426CC93|nr:hypothetical protein [Bradyrhizobium sp. Tv2a-2]
MAKDAVAFEIDDVKTVDQNISAFTTALKTIDCPLADLISASLAKLSLEVSVDHDELLDDLYAAAAATKPEQPSSEESPAQ